MNSQNIKQRTQKIKGTTYVYEDYPYWDREKQQTRHKRVYIGKLDAKGEFVPNKTYAAKMKLEEAKQGGASMVEQSVARTYYGATCLLDAIADITGIKKDLKASFPHDYLKILSLASYLVMESDSPMYRFSRWAHTHWHPYGLDLPSQRISELFASIKEDARIKFFIKQKTRRTEKEHLAYDTTSISSYSELINHVKYGKNKDGEPLPQINLTLVFGQESMMPVYYRRLPGNITDVRTVRKLLKDLDYMEFKKIKLVMDRGFFSAKNLNDLYKHHYKFLIAGKGNMKFVSKYIDRVRDSIKDFSNYAPIQDVYQISSMEKWPYEEYDGQGCMINKSQRRVYVHVYYNGQRAESEKTTFLKVLSDAEACLVEDSCSEAQKAMCDKFFVHKKTPVRGVKIQYNEEAIHEHMNTFGYFVLLSNDIKDPSEALFIYRNKDLIEKFFGNIKNRLSMRRPLVSSDESLDGKLFVQFVALMLISYIHKNMKDHDLYKNYTMQKLLDELDVIERFDFPGKRAHFSEVTTRQQHIYSCFGVKPPNML